MVKHIIFDCDGVLIDTEIVAAEVLSQWLSQQGFAISTSEFIDQFTGKTFTDIIQSLKSNGKLANELDVKSAVPALDRLIQARIRPIDGVHEMLSNVNAPISAVSNSAKSYVEHALMLLKSLYLFNGRIFSAEMVSEGKPSPKVYQLAIKKLQLKNQEVVVVEDSLSGAQASIAAGLTTIGFLGGSHIREGHKERLKHLGVTRFAHDHRELSKMLGSIISNT